MLDEPVVLVTTAQKKYSGTLYAENAGDWMLKDCEEDGGGWSCKCACFRGEDVESIRVVHSNPRWADVSLDLSSDLTDTLNTSKEQISGLSTSFDSSDSPTHRRPRHLSPQSHPLRSHQLPTLSQSEQSLVSINIGLLHWTPPLKVPDPPDSLLDLFLYSVPEKFPRGDGRWMV